MSAKSEGSRFAAAGGRFDGCEGVWRESGWCWCGKSVDFVVVVDVVVRVRIRSDFGCFSTAACSRSGNWSRGVGWVRGEAVCVEHGSGCCSVVVGSIVGVSGGGICICTIHRSISSIFFRICWRSASPSKGSGEDVAVGRDIL